LTNTVSLKKNSHFQYVYKNGRSAADGPLVMLVTENSLGYNRLGITVSKKVGISVVRNRARRLIREAYRLNEARFKIGFDIVYVARRRIAALKYSEVEVCGLRLAKRLMGILDG